MTPTGSHGIRGVIMKNKFKLISVIALTLIIAFSMAACKSADEKAKDNLQGTWKYSVTVENVVYTQTLVFSGSSLTITNTGSDTKEVYTFSVSGDTITLKKDGEEDQTIKFTFSDDKKTLTIKDEKGNKIGDYKKV